MDSLHLFGWQASSMMIYSACNSLWFSWTAVAVEARKTVEIDPFLIINQLVPDSVTIHISASSRTDMLTLEKQSGHFATRGECSAPFPPAPRVSCTICQYIYDNTCMYVYDFPCACIFPTSAKNYPWQVEVRVMTCRLVETRQQIQQCQKKMSKQKWNR